MLGQFLEVALVAADASDDWQRLQRLGFEPAPTGDIWPHAYGVVTCEGLAIGLHARGDDPLSVVFVRPEVAALHRELSAHGIDIETARLGSDAFNELTLREPGGIALKVLEARSFSPPAHVPARTVPGRFRRLSLPGRDLDGAMEFWAALGARCEPMEDPWQGFTIAGSPVACHARRVSTGPLLVFDSPEAGARQLLEDAGFAIRPRLSALGNAPHLVAQGPEDLTLLMML
ncbi:MAG TPA: hypothetical protein VKO83_13790 [Steroidobacteraceae bacterium]|nr:hypothetical protein [Steroidobacteraceae bacterium]